MRYLYITIFLLALLLSPVARAQFELFENLLDTPQVEESDDFPLDLVWEASTHVPAEYEGKALPINGSIIVVSALTPTKNSAGLTFTWRVEDSSSAKRIEHASLSKNQFAFSAEAILPNFVHTISVRADETTTGQAASERINISVRSPDATMRALSPSGALLEPAVNILSLPAGSKLSLIARTFFFNSEVDELNFSWMFDGKRISGGGSPERLDISVGSGSGGAERNVLLEVLRPGSRERAVHTIKLEVK